MPISKQKKAEIIEEMGRHIASSETIVFVNFHGLPVIRANALRRELRERGVGYAVAKKTLIRRALELSGRKIIGDCPPLDGEIALAFLSAAGGDEIAPAKEIYEFQSKSASGHPAPDGEKLKIIGGIFQGSYVSAAAMMGIAAIPPRETLYSQLANLFNSPLRRLVVALDQVSKLAR